MSLRQCAFCGRFIPANIRWCDRSACNQRFTTWRDVRLRLMRRLTRGRVHTV